MAEWSGAPPPPPREAHWVRSSNLAMGDGFFHFLNAFWLCVKCTNIILKISILMSLLTQKDKDAQLLLFEVMLF